MQLFAHRGGYFPYPSYEYHIDNLRYSILSEDNHGIEVDVRFTKDHVPVIHHDPVYNNHPISSINYSETSLVQIEDILQLWTSRDKTLLIEIKGRPSITDITLFINVLSGYNWIKKRILSFRQDVLNFFIRFDRVLLISTYLLDWSSILRNGYKGIGLSLEIIDDDLLSLLEGYEIYIFTVNYPILVSSWDHNIITDFPELFRYSKEFSISNDGKRKLPILTVL